MANSNSVANGARLDDCHSTVFSLADLSGIKWHRFSSVSSGLTDDPVLGAFTKCLALDILAVWRKSTKKPTIQTPIPQEGFERELWIFWWGDEPHIDEISQQRGLTDGGRGSWEEGLSYECRTLLFKAIHNLVERCLLNENFVRIGRWFVKPFNKDTEEDISDRFSFSFSFFLHGESSVCTTVEVAKHQPLERLTYQRFQQTNSTSNNSVVLSPHGLAATLTGVACRNPHEPTVKKVLEEWRPFYPMSITEDFSMDGLCDEDGEDNIPVPPVVEVLIAGVQMNYPSHYVLCPVGEVPGPPKFQSYSDTGQKRMTISDKIKLPLGRSPARSVDTSYEKSMMGPPSVTSVTDQSLHGPQSVGSSLFSPPSVKSTPQKNNIASSRESCRTPSVPNQSISSSIIKRICMGGNTAQPSQDAALNPNNNSNRNSSEEVQPTSPADSKWDFSDSFKDIRYRPASSRPYSNPLEGRHSVKLERQQRSRPNTPFHHRTHENEAPLPPMDPATSIALSTRTPALVNGQSDFAEPAQAFCPVKLEHPDTLPLENKFFQPKPNYASVDMNPPQPFVSIPQPNEWDSVEQNNMPSHHAFAVDDIEIKRSVGDWKTYKLPIGSTDQQNHPKRPTLLCDSLDSRGYAFNHNKTTLSETAMLYSCPTRKRLKVEESAEKHPTQFIKQENQYFNHDSVNHHHIGMSIRNIESDPYAFEDDLDDHCNTNGVQNFSDIILNKNQPQQNPGKLPQDSLGFEYGDNLANEQDQNLGGRSQLEVLLTQNTDSPSNKPVVQSNKTINMSSMLASKSMKSKSDLTFSMDDLAHMFDDEEDEGAPTPPDDTEDRVYKKPQQKQISNSHAATATDLQRMFPTPPSLEQCQAFSPEGRPVLPPTAPQPPHADDPTPNPTDPPTYPEKMEEQIFPEDLHVSYEQQTAVCRTNKLKQHPASTIYQPIKCLSSTQLPLHTLSYIPLWQLPVPVASEPQFMVPSISMSEHLNNPPVTPATPGNIASLTPGTPSRSARTPGAQPTPSPNTFQVPTPRTPGRGGIRSVDPLESPASSFATPNSHMTSKGLYMDHNGNAAISMNLLLSDSVLNLFRDRSFDQCALCVCNSNISGADISMGCLPALGDQEAQFRCYCGFSAVRNRMASVGTGLFLEDELEVVGPKFENAIIRARCQSSSNHLNSENTEELLQLAMEYSASPFTTSELCKDLEPDGLDSLDEDNIVVKHDICEACALALSGSLSAMEHPQKIDADSISDPLHHWKLTRSEVFDTAGGIDIYRLLVSLKPVLQDAIQKKRISRSFGTTQHVKGPLTWREFCKEAGKNAEPQSIPSFVVGYNHDWICISPESLKHWEKLYLEPYSCPRDVGYVVVCPDGDNLVTSARTFFKELSCLYESSRLGRFKPINKVLKDGGILRIGKNSPKQPNLPDDWFDKLQQQLNGSNSDKSSESDAIDKLILYAKECLHNLGQLLKAEPSLEISSLHVRESRSRGTVNRTTPLTHMSNNIGRSPAQPQSTPATILPVKDTRPVYHPSYNAATACSIVVYLLDPFNGSFSRGLWHCFRILQKSLPKPLRDHIIFQIVPIEHVLRVGSPNNRQSFVHAVRSLSFSTFAQCRRILLHEVKVRSMTGFGPAASDKRYMIEHKENIPCETRLYTPPYVLSIPREPAQAIMKTEPPSNILFVTYCVSHNQKFVLVSATDQSGELLETCCINIDVPPRRLSVSRKHRVSVRSEAIDKLWKFCVATVSRMSTTTWRIVIGRLGRLSHGEIRDWGKHLHRRSLLSCSRRASCTQCKLQQCAEGSFIISACLTSLEPDGALMLMPDVVQMNNFGRSNSSINQSNQLRTPEDISCTHIYVFPTSADTQLPGANFQTGVEEDPYMVQPDADLIPVDVLDGLVEENDNFINDIMGDGADLDDIMGVSSSTVSHQPLKLDDGQPTTESSILPGDPGSQEDVLLSQQPLALGYMVSTAPPGPLPAWFWSTCPYAKNRCPVFLRSALHIQTSVNDATTHQGSIEGNHPLDSNKTAVVLRFVLENYNALSWLTTDPVTKGRRSCLPVHCLSLMQLYHTVRNLLG